MRDLWIGPCITSSACVPCSTTSVIFVIDARARFSLNSDQSATLCVMREPSRVYLWSFNDPFWNFAMPTYEYVPNVGIFYGLICQGALQTRTLSFLSSLSHGPIRIRSLVRRTLRFSSERQEYRDDVRNCSHQFVTPLRQLPLLQIHAQGDHSVW